MSPLWARRFYSVAWWLALPVVALYLLWRSLRQPAYRQHWRERFLGQGALPRGKPVVWLHAVSVGETRAAQPLLEALQAVRPDLHFVLTHMTPTGRATGAAWIACSEVRQRSYVQRYLAYELPFALRQFFTQTQPALGILMETEVWPNLLAQARRAQVPMVLVNARLSEKSLARAQRLLPLMKEATNALTGVLAQSEADQQRLACVYDGPIEVTGNLKFDLTPDADLVVQGQALKARCNGRPLWLAASTREGEEALILQAFIRAQAGTTLQAKAESIENEPDPILCLVPRHPQRFNEVAALIEAHGLSCVRRSTQAWAEVDFLSLPSRTVLLGDTMGEMALYYAAADVVLMGGSWLPFGAQNLIEPCAVGTPVLLGPSTYNFAQVAKDAVAIGAALQVTDLTQAFALLAELQRNRARHHRMQQAALQFAQAHRGATARTVQLLLKHLPASI